MKTVLRFSLITLTIFLVGLVPLMAQTVHQVAAGDSTLRDAIDAAADGDIIELTTSGGVYVNPDITLDKSITIRAQDGLFDKPILKVTDGSQFFKLDTTASLTLKGLDLDGDATDLGASSILKYSIIVDTDDTTMAAITINIDDCVFHESTDKLIKLYGLSVVDSVNIHNSTFYNCAKEAVCLYEGSSSAPMARLDYAEVINSTFYAIGREAIKLQSNPDTKLLVDHITCYDVGNTETKAIIYVRDASDVIVKNSIFQNNNETTGYISLANQSNVLNNCVNWDVVDKDIDNSDAVTDTLWADPLFVDPANADFTLGEGSPAIGFADDGKVAGDLKWDPNYTEVVTHYINAGDGTLAEAIDAAADGDIIELVDDGGLYDDTGNNYLIIDKTLTIKARDGYNQKPVVKVSASSGQRIMEIRAGGNLTLKGLDLDCRDAEGNRSQKNAIRSQDVSDTTGAFHFKLFVDDCYLHHSAEATVKGHRFTIGDSVVFTNTIFDEAYNEAVLFRESTSNLGPDIRYAEFTNCTFTKIGREALYAEFSNPVIKFNHCTFDSISWRENKRIINTVDIDDVEIKNSVFTNQLGTQSEAIQIYGNSTISYCDTLHIGDIDLNDAATIGDGMLGVDPQYKDPANDDYRLATDSPVRGAADDGRAMGDLRWETDPGQFRLTLGATGNGIISADPEGPFYDPGTSVTLTATPDQDWVVASWSGVNVFPPNASTATVTMDADKAVTVTFELALEKFSVNASVVGVGHLVFDPAPLDSTDWTYYDGTEVTITAVSDSASMAFSEWTGDLTGSDNPAVLTVDAAKTITAVFTPTVTQYVLDVDTVGLGNVYLMPQPYADYGSYDEGAEVTLVADPLSGFEFSGWSGDVTDSNDTIMVTMDSSIAVTATFIEITVADGILEVDTSMVFSDAVAFARNNSQVKKLVLTTSGGVYKAHETIDVDFPLTIMAAEGLAEKPKIEGNPDLSYSNGVFQVRAGGTELVLDGVEIYGTKYAVRTDDVELTTKIWINDCYIHDSGEVWVKVYANSFVDSLVITNCVFREVPKEGIYLKEPNTFKYAELDNSTFIRAGREALRARDNIESKVVINHCTFDSTSWNENYRVVYPEGVAETIFKNSIITNQMFLTERHPDFARVYGTSVVSNIVVFNASNHADPEENAVIDTTMIWEFDPLFEAPEMRDYTLQDASHAYGIADDGEAAGDLRWATGTPTHKMLTITLDGNGMVSLDPEPVGKTYDPGTQVSVTAIADSGYVFKEWSGALTGNNNPETITLDNDVTVTALFVLATDIESVFGLPTEYALHQNFPNPFNPQTTIAFDLKEAGETTVKVFDVLGREIATLINKKMQPGRYQVIFYKPNMATGVYFYQIKSGKFTAIKKMLLVK